MVQVDLVSINVKHNQDKRTIIMPTLFVSHGAPTLALEPGKTGALLKTLASELPLPQAIVVISAHWDTSAPMVTSSLRLSTIHDFAGFPAAMYELKYPAQGAPWLAKRLVEILSIEGIKVTEDDNRGLDHGAWIPLMLMYPAADIPVVQLSIQGRQSPEYHLTIGRALQALHADNVLILASGAITHNLGDFFTVQRDSVPLAYVTQFADWVADCIAENNLERLCQYRTSNEHGARAHPTADHILPLFVALGTAKGGLSRYQPESTYGILAMDIYSWFTKIV